MVDFGKSRTIHTVRWPEIGSMLSSLNPSDYYAGLGQRTLIRDRIDGVAADLRQWLHPIIDLSSLPNHYHTNGTHGAIEQWIASERRPIYCLRGEYPYPSHISAGVRIADSVGDIPLDAVVYMSNPFSSNGRYDARYDLITNPLVLDIAYVGTTDLRRIDMHGNVEQVFWSASKAFGLGNFRTGYRFSRTPDKLQDQLKDTGYFNWLGIEILGNAIKLMRVTDAWQRLHSEYRMLCDAEHLEMSDTYLIAISHDERFRHLVRGDGTIRVPTGRILDGFGR